MMTRQRCAICDCDRDGNVWPESADVLCRQHWGLLAVRGFMRCGALSDWPPLQVGKHPMAVMHRTMLLTKDERYAAARPLSWQVIVLAACSGRDVWWDDGTG